MSRAMIGLAVIASIALTKQSYASEQDADFRSLLKLRIHQQVEEIRANQDEIINYLLESNVRKVQMDYIISFRKKGLTYEEIQKLFASPSYQKLFQRIRQNPVLQKRAQTFVDKLTSPYYLEERTIQKHIEFATEYNEEQQQAYQRQLLELQRAIRKIKTKKPAPTTFWAHLRQSIRAFLGIPT
ncbi:MAG: hypothetical protein R3A45_07430 [Bdellovibrionota bacterium]